MSGKKIRGWFSTPGRLGDRTIDEQMKGLGPLLERVPGKSVLDVGCAEGLIAFRLDDVGARMVHGIEIVPEHVEVGKKLRGDRAVGLEVADANDWQPVQYYDIVIALASLHKLWNPSEAAARFASAARELVVLRLPPQHAPTIVDPRSSNVPHRIGNVMKKAGFELTLQTKGHFDEWVGYYERRV